MRIDEIPENTGLTGEIAGRSVAVFRGSEDTYVFENNFNATFPEDLISIQNYPNPFNSCTNIIYNLPESNYVTLEIFNLAGQVITTFLMQ